MDNFAYRAHRDQNRISLPNTNSHNNENTPVNKGKEEKSDPNPAICVGFPWLLVGGFNPFEKY